MLWPNALNGQLLRLVGAMQRGRDGVGFLFSRNHDPYVPGLIQHQGSQGYAVGGAVFISRCDG